MCFFFSLDPYWGAYSVATLSSTSKTNTTRKYPKAADKVLDAPNMIDDFCELQTSIFAVEDLE